MYQPQPPTQPVQHAAPKQPWFRRTWGIAVIALAALGIGGAVAQGTTSKSTAADAAQPTATVTATATATQVHNITHTKIKIKKLRPTVIKTVATRTRTQTVTYTPAPKPAISDGTYQVGRDINPGTFRTSGGSHCYYEVDSDPNGNSIISNNLSSGPMIVSVSVGQYLQLNGGCEWRHD